MSDIDWICLKCGETNTHFGGEICIRCGWKRPTTNDLPPEDQCYCDEISCVECGKCAIHCKCKNDDKE